MFSSGSGISALTLTRDGRFCIAGHCGLVMVVGHPAPIYVWDMSSRRIVREVVGLAGKVVQIQCSYDSRFACASGANQLLMVFEIASGEIVYSRRTEQVAGFCIFAPRSGAAEEYKFVAVSEAVIDVYRMRFDLSLMKFSVITSTKACGNIYRKAASGGICAVMPDETHLFISSLTGDVLVYTIEGNEVRFAGSIAVGTLPVSAMSITDSGEIAAVAGGTKLVLLEYSKGKSLKLSRQIFETDHETRPTICSLEYANESFWITTSDGVMQSVASSGGMMKHIADSMSSSALRSHSVADSSKIATVCANGDIQLWDTSAVRKILSFNHSKASGLCTASSLHGHVLACGYENGCVRLFELVQSGFLLGEIPAAHRGVVGCISLTEDLIYTGGLGDSTLRVWRRSSLTLPVCQVTQSSGGVSFALPDKFNADIVYYANQRREIFAVSIFAAKVLVKFNSSPKFGQVTGMAQIMLPSKNPAVSDPALVTSHEEGKLVFWDFDFQNPVKVFQLPDFVFTCLCLADETILAGAANGQIVQCRDGENFFVNPVDFVPEPITCMQWIPTTKQVLCVNSSGVVLLVALPCLL